MFDFLNEEMDGKGKINYFNKWEGFNLPGKVFHDFMSVNTDITPFENKIFKSIDLQHWLDADFYIIGALEKDKCTINHELAHAFFYLDQNYREEVSDIISHFASDHEELFSVIKSKLLKDGYNMKVVVDEIQAYIATDTISQVYEYFKIPGCGEIQELKKSLENVFKERLVQITNATAFEHSTFAK